MTQRILLLIQMLIIVLMEVFSALHNIEVRVLGEWRLHAFCHVFQIMLRPKHQRRLLLHQWQKATRLILNIVCLLETKQMIHITV